MSSSVSPSNSPRVVQISTSLGGVPKLPIASGMVTPLGLTGDKHSHPQIHGGPRKALLLVTAEGIEELKQQGYSLYPGALGENITTEGLDRHTIRLGQRYRIGQIVVEISQLRQPCDTLTPYGEGIQRAVYDADVKSGNHTSPRWGLGGFYTSVIKTGTIHLGDTVTLLEESA